MKKGEGNRVAEGRRTAGKIRKEIKDEEEKGKEDNDQESSLYNVSLK